MEIRIDDRFYPVSHGVYTREENKRMYMACIDSAMMMIEASNIDNIWLRRLEQSYFAWRVVVALSLAGFSAKAICKITDKKNQSVDKIIRIYERSRRY